MSEPNAAPDPNRTPAAPITGRSHIRLHTLFGTGPWSCTYCRKRLECPCTTGLDSWTFWRERHQDGATADHIVPTTRGGTDDPDNIVPACMACNSSKNGRIWPDEWVPDLHAATYVYRAEVAPIWGEDTLPVLGLLTLLASLEPGCRYPLGDVSVRVGDAPGTAIRAELSRLARAGRLAWRVVPGIERPYEHEFSAVVK